MPFQFDAVVWDFMKPILAVIVPLLLLDGIMLLLIRRLWTPRPKLTRPDYEAQTIDFILTDIVRSDDTSDSGKTSSRGNITEELSTDFRAA